MLEHRGGPHVKQQATPVSLVSTGAYTVIHHSHLKEEPTEISDSDKRMFLKLIGSTGIFLFFYSILNKRIGSLLFNDMATPSRNLALGNAVPADIKPDEDQIKEQYRIAEVDDSVVAYFGYINKDGGWYIMKADTENGSFRYAKGDFDFAVHWQNRQNLQYNYFHLVF